MVGLTIMVGWFSGVVFSVRSRIGDKFRFEVGLYRILSNGSKMVALGTKSKEQQIFENWEWGGFSFPVLFT